MAKIKLDIDDAEAVLVLVDVLTGRRAGGHCFVDRHDRTRLSPFYTVAVMNFEVALREQRKRASPKVAERNAAHPPR